MESTTQIAGQGLRILQYEFIDSKGLASRWALADCWIREQVRSRAADPLPHVHFGKYVRFRWGSPELEDWAEQRIVNGSNRDKRDSSAPERRLHEENSSPLGRVCVQEGLRLVSCATTIAS